MGIQYCRNPYPDSTGLQCLVDLKSLTLQAYTHDVFQEGRIAKEVGILQVAQ